MTYAARLDARRREHAAAQGWTCHRGHAVSPGVTHCTECRWHTERDLCECGTSKWRTSKTCLDCYTKRQKDVGRPFLDRFVAKIAISDPCECWPWLASTDKQGYGKFWLPGGAFIAAHRASFQLFVGELRDGHLIHHMCEHRQCVNPWHLEQIPRSMHGSRHLRSTCPRGHALAGENVRWWGNARHCRECDRTRRQERSLRKRLERA